MAFCKNFNAEFKKAKRLLEDKAVNFVSQAILRTSSKILLFLENPIVDKSLAKFTDLTAFEDDEKLIASLKTAMRNAIDASAFMQTCRGIEDDNKRLQCYLESLSKLNQDQWRDEVGLYAARCLKFYLQHAKGITEKLGILKIVIEGFLITNKKSLK